MDLSWPGNLVSLQEFVKLAQAELIPKRPQVECYPQLRQVLGTIPTRLTSAPTMRHIRCGMQTKQLRVAGRMVTLDGKPLALMARVDDLEWWLIRQGYLEPLKLRLDRYPWQPPALARHFDELEHAETARIGILAETEGSQDAGELLTVGAYPNHWVVCRRGAARHLEGHPHVQILPEELCLGEWARGR